MYDSGVFFKVEVNPAPPPNSTSSPGANVPWIAKDILDRKLSFAINIKHL